jgi:hypothetical protein
VHDCIDDESPLFVEGTILYFNFNIEAVMSHTFVPQYISPCRNTGYYDVVYVLFTDILGRTRPLEDVVDIGPYELSVFSVEFDANQIKNLYQDKLNYDGFSSFITTTKQKIYEDLPKKFVYDSSICYEYARESKIFIELKTNTNPYTLITDKTNISLIQLEAYYDDAQNTIIIKKIPQLIGSLFNKIFESGQYTFVFNERYNTLYIYILDTYNKGLSGTRSIVNNNRFGGSSITSI